MKSLPNLLIVDDHEENLFLLEVILKKVKVNLITALSGDQALMKTRRLELALAIIDVRMPGMDGYELAEKLNEERTDDKVPVIFLTASNINETEEFKGYNSGAVDYLSKPFVNHILLSKISVFLDLFNQKQNIIRNAALLKASADELKKVNTALKKSEGRLRDIMFSMADWVWEMDENGVYTYSSKRGSELLGVTHDQIIGKTPFDFMSPDEVQRAEEIFSEIMANKAAIKDYESWNIGKNGERICLLTNGVPIIDEFGNFKGYRGVDKDITIRKCVEAALQESEEKYRNYIDHAPEGVFVADETGKFLEVNEAICSTTKYSEDELLDMSISDLLTEVSRKNGLTFLSNVVKTGTSRIELSFLDKYQLLRWWNLSAVKLKDSGILCFTEEITYRKKMEDELRQANSFLDSIIENIPDTVFIKDARNLRYLKFNRAGEELFGHKKEQVIGKTVYESFVKDQADLFNLSDLEAIQNRTMIDLPDTVIRTPNNDVRIIHTKKVPILNDEGDPLYLLGITEDITKRKVAEQTLKVSEEKYRTMLNASPDGIFLIDFNGRITDVSEIGIELFGFDTKEELIGKHFMNFVLPEGKKIILDVITKTMNEGIAQNVEMRIKKKNQTMFLSEASSTLIQGADGKHFSFMIIIRDISFRKKMETKQMHADRMANLGEMASGIAHEINQPLNIISMVMDKILFETSKTEFIDIGFLKTKADKIFDNITRIRNIIDHVRAFSRSHDDYVLTAFDINASIENAASMIAEQFKHLGINLSLILDKQIPQLIGNTYKFEQVIVNLLTNAKDAVIEKKNRQEGFSDLLVSIQTFQENHFLIVEIADNGIGIVNDDLHNIMLPFYTTKEEGKGTGLGLSISYQIIKDMGGTIDIASNKLTGTIIKLVLNIPKGK